MLQTHRFWNDAKFTAKQDSMKTGFAWIVQVHPEPGFARGKVGGFQVVVGETTEEAPAQYNAEFKNGIEQ